MQLFTTFFANGSVLVLSQVLQMNQTTTISIPGGREFRPSQLLPDMGRHVRVENRGLCACPYLWRGWHSCWSLPFRSSTQNTREGRGICHQNENDKRDSIRPGQCQLNVGVNLMCAISCNLETSVWSMEQKTKMSCSEFNKYTLTQRKGQVLTSSPDHERPRDKLLSIMSGGMGPGGRSGSRGRGSYTMTTTTRAWLHKAVLDSSRSEPKSPIWLQIKWLFPPLTVTPSTPRAPPSDWIKILLYTGWSTLSENHQAVVLRKRQGESQNSFSLTFKLTFLVISLYSLFACSARNLASLASNSGFWKSKFCVPVIGQTRQ